jgi:hypothetical protein
VSIALLVMTDGRRDCLPRAIESLERVVTGPITRRVIHDDSGDIDYRRWLRETYPGYDLVMTVARSGFGGAYASAWTHLAQGCERLVFGVEDDFVFQRPVDLAAMADVLDAHPQLAQLALRRQAWNADEHAAGGVVEQHPDAYEEHRDDLGRVWLEHQLYLTTNPGLYRRGLCAAGWPVVPQSEGQLTHRLLREGMAWDGIPGDQVRFGLWGARHSGVWVEHIGHTRAGTGY